jgi:hypothetical protein
VTTTGNSELRAHREFFTDSGEIPTLNSLTGLLPKRKIVGTKTLIRVVRVVTTVLTQKGGSRPELVACQRQLTAILHGLIEDTALHVDRAVPMFGTAS